MKMKTLLSCGMTLAALCGAGYAPAHAADPPATPPAKAGAPAAQPKPTPKLSDKELDTVLTTLNDYAGMLKKAGYTAQVGTKKQGGQLLNVSWKDKTGSYGVDLTQHAGGKMEELTFVAPLSSFVQHPKVPAEVFFKLVEAQDATHGWYFVFNPKVQALFLCRTIPTTKITARQLITELDNLQFAAQITARVWNPAEWITKQQTPASTPPAQTPKPATKAADPAPAAH